MAALLHSPLALLIAQLLVIIAAARLLGLGARRLQQPLVIAEVVAGIVLGPSLLGLVAPEFEAVLFPQASLGVLGLLSHLGLILFMFLVGLEIDMRLLRGRAYTAVLISHTSIVLPFALGAVLALYLHPLLSEPGVSRSSFTLFLGVAMSITAFPVLARILTERRLLRTRVGAMAITCAAVDDVTAWCILAFVVSIVRSTATGAAVWTTVLALAYTLLMLSVVRPFLGRLAARGSDREGLTQNAVAVTFLLLLLSSWTTELIGIHALFGAFLMGAMIPRDGGFARVLAEKLEDVVVTILLPTFFALSGLRTQIGLLDTAEAWLQCAMIIAVACLGKFGGGFLAARWTGLGRREAAALGVLMNTRGLMELIVLNIGLDLGVISPTLFTMMVLMALFTTFITTPLLQRVYPPEAIAEDLLAARQQPQVAEPAAFGVLMCVAQGRSGPGMALVARALAGESAGDCRLYGLQLLRPTGRTSDLLDGDVEAGSALDPLLAHGRQHGLDVRPIAFVSGEPAHDICNVAEIKDVDLVLLGWHKPLLGQAMLGGTVYEVMQAARTDVGVLLNRGLTEIRRVLVPFHGSAHDRTAVALGVRMARASGVEVTVLRVRHADDGAAGSDAFLRATAGAVRFEELDSIAAGRDATDHVLAAASQGYDLVLIGMSEEWGLTPRPFGLRPEDVLQKCVTSVLVIRHHARHVDGPRPRDESAAEPHGV